MAQLPRNDPTKGGFSLLAIITGFVVALAATAGFAGLVWLGLDYQGHDLHEVIRGDNTWASVGGGSLMMIGLFVAFLWGGYAAGRMGVSAGAGNGIGIAFLALFAVLGTGLYLVAVQELETVTLDAGIGTLPLDGNFTPLGFGAVAIMVVAAFAGSIYGGVLGSRWHTRRTDQTPMSHPSYATDSFSDLQPATQQHR